MKINLEYKPFRFSLKKKLITSKGVIKEKRGWLIHLEDSIGNHGWGEVSPMDYRDEKIYLSHLQDISKTTSSKEILEHSIISNPKYLGFGIGAALGELEGKVGLSCSDGWLKAPPSAILLPQTKDILKSIESLIHIYKRDGIPITIKWKVAIKENRKEENIMKEILQILPPNFRLRIDANGGWKINDAKRWFNLFERESKLEWIEEPLESINSNELFQLSKQIPIALDESLIQYPDLKNTWEGWQVRHPLIEGDPRILLLELKKNVSHRMISTAFETGIGRRWIDHMSAIQQKGPTPTAPGLAPGWLPKDPLFSNNPFTVWDAV